MDDRGSGWPGDDDRLAQIQDTLATLQNDIAQLTRLLPGLLKSDPRTPWNVWTSPGSADEPPATSRRGRGIDMLRFRSDAIGGVEKQLTTLRWEVERLLRLVDLPPTPRAGGPPRTPTLKSGSAGGWRGDTMPEAPREAMPTGDQADGGAGDDDLNRSLYPTQGPGGAGPWYTKTQEQVEPEEPNPGFGFFVAGGQARGPGEDQQNERSTAPCTVRASCTDDTDHCINSTRWFGIIRRIGP